MPIPTPSTALQTHIWSKCAVQNIHGHTDSKNVFVLRLVFWSASSGMDVYNQFAKFFIQLSFLFLYLCCLPEMHHTLRLTIIYHTEWWNARTKSKKWVVLSKMPLDKGSAAMGVEIKETKRQSRAVKVTHPPADRRQLHKQMKWAASQVQWSNSVMKRLHKQGFLELVKMWRKTSFLSEERLSPREDIMRDTRGLSRFCLKVKKAVCLLIKTDLC